MRVQSTLKALSKHSQSTLKAIAKTLRRNKKGIARQLQVVNQKYSLSKTDAM
jgi:hypothetical protein